MSKNIGIIAKVRHLLHQSHVRLLYLTNQFENVSHYFFTSWFYFWPSFVCSFTCPKKPMSFNMTIYIPIKPHYADDTTLTYCLQDFLDYFTKGVVSSNTDLFIDDDEMDRVFKNKIFGSSYYP